jgi:hypothetical protein
MIKKIIKIDKYFNNNGLIDIRSVYSYKDYENSIINNIYNDLLNIYEDYKYLISNELDGYGFNPFEKLKEIKKSYTNFYFTSLKDKFYKDYINISPIYSRKGNIKNYTSLMSNNLYKFNNFFDNGWEFKNKIDFLFEPKDIFLNANIDIEDFKFESFIASVDGRVLRAKDSLFQIIKESFNNDILDNYLKLDYYKYFNKQNLIDFVNKMKELFKDNNFLKDLNNYYCDSLGKQDFHLRNFINNIGILNYVINEEESIRSSNGDYVFLMDGATDYNFKTVVFYNFLDEKDIKELRTLHGGYSCECCSGAVDIKQVGLEELIYKNDSLKINYNEDLNKVVNQLNNFHIIEVNN